MDAWEYVGKQATLIAPKLPRRVKGFDLIYTGNSFANEETTYHERLRPQFHFTARRGWIQNPTGMIYYDGEYHMFPLHYPYNWKERTFHWHWGHVVSSDLIHWKELPTALYPDDMGGMATGSIVIDSSNTSGFQTGDEKVMVAVYTAFGPESSVECVAYSNDRGRTWTKYEGNPV